LTAESELFWQFATIRSEQQQEGSSDEPSGNCSNAIAKPNGNFFFHCLLRPRLRARNYFIRRNFRVATIAFFSESHLTSSAQKTVTDGGGDGERRRMQFPDISSKRKKGISCSTCSRRGEAKQKVAEMIGKSFRFDRCDVLRISENFFSPLLSFNEFREIRID
jgi:hypothetical protein